MKWKSSAGNHYFVFLFIFIWVIILLFTMCTKQVKPIPANTAERIPSAETNTNYSFKPESIKEPTPEEEKNIILKINFDGKWRKHSTGSKAIIIISGKTGKIIGKNGGEIPIIVKYITENTVKILEYEYNPKYLSNWLPESIAQQIYLNGFLQKTYSILRIVDEDTLKGTSYAWQVIHSEGIVKKIEPLVTGEEWKRVTNE